MLDNRKQNRTRHKWLSNLKNEDKAVPTDQMDFDRDIMDVSHPFVLLNSNELMQMPVEKLQMMAKQVNINCQNKWPQIKWNSL
jgi:hypothetical protein